MRKAALGVFGGAGIWFAFSVWDDRLSFFQSYLFAYLYWLSIPLGSLGLILTLNLTGGRWGELSRGILEAMARTTSGMALLLLPLFFGLKQLFPWASATQYHNEHSPHKAVYFSTMFFAARTLLYLGCWIWLAYGLTVPRAPARALSGGGLIVFGFTVTFAAIDWQMSLEPAWYSTIYGMLFAIGQALEAWAFAVAILCTTLLHRSERKPPDRVLRDIGNILLTLIILWTYLSFMQYLIIWSGNLPDEVKWFLARTRGGWLTPVILLAVFQFAAPFSALLLRASKEHLSILRILAASVIVARAVEQHWLVVPAFFPARFHVSSADLAAWLTVGGLWFWLFLGKLRAENG